MTAPHMGGGAVLQLTGFLIIEPLLRNVMPLSGVRGVGGNFMLALGGSSC
jgi:hypothetical protein